MPMEELAKESVKETIKQTTKEKLYELKQQIQKFTPFNEQEERDKAILVKWFESGMDILTRENEVAHLTASAWVVSPDRKRVLMAYHNIYHSWAWLGGHADGDADLHHVAKKEVMEESGVAHVKFLSDEPFSIEILSVDGHVKKGRYVSTHLHLNVTYLMEADPAEAVQNRPEENSAVAWIPVGQIAEKSTEPWFVEHVYAKLCEKVKSVKTINQIGL